MNMRRDGFFIRPMSGIAAAVDGAVVDVVWRDGVT
jgi:hypothetical protein